jgi:hypothetical protein
MGANVHCRPAAGSSRRGTPQTGQRVSSASFSRYVPGSSRQAQYQAIGRAWILRFGWTFELNTA